MSNFCYCTSHSRWQWCELSNFLVHPGLWSVLLGWDLGCVPQTEVTQMVFLLIKGVMQQKNEVLFNLLFTWAFSLYPCSAFLLPPPKCLFFFKETYQTKQTQACLGGSAISSCFMHAEGAGERVLLMAKMILGESSPLFLPNLRLSSDVLWFGGENLKFFTSKYLKQSSNFESQRWFWKWKFSALCNHLRKICIFSLFVIGGVLRVLSSFDERPFGVRICFSVLVFPGSESTERKTGLMCVSFPAKWSVWEND